MCSKCIHIFIHMHILYEYMQWGHQSLHEKQLLALLPNTINPEISMKEPRLKRGQFFLLCPICSLCPACGGHLICLHFPLVLIHGVVHVYRWPGRTCWFVFKIAAPSAGSDFSFSQQGSTSFYSRGKWTEDFMRHFLATVTAPHTTIQTCYKIWLKN